jgi:sugar-specific transcriptional regulator TrmB/predicted transcriptional regulator
MMSEDRIAKVLNELGLSRREAEIYVFLTKKGVRNAHSVSTSLKIDRVQIYRALKSLQDKGIVEATLETPTRFSAVSFDTLVTSHIMKKKGELAELEAKKEGLVADWRSLGVREEEYPLPRFKILMERNRIYDEVSRMIEETKNEILELTTGVGIIQEDIFGILDSIIAYTRKNPNIQAKILTNISKENYEIVEQLLKTASSQKLNVQLRHLALASGLSPRFMIKDGEETVLYVASGDDLSTPNQSDTGLWISSRLFVSALRESHGEMWRNAVDAKQRIEELKTGKPIVETSVMSDVQEARAKLEKILESAEHEIVAVTSSDGINTILGDDLLKSCSERGVKLRLMAPVDLDNLDAALKLSETYEIRHVPISYLMMLLVDDRDLFIFKTPPVEKKIPATAFSLDNVFYTNDERYVDRVSEMLDDIWRRGLDIKEMNQGTTTPNVQVSSTDTTYAVVETMFKNNANTVIVADDNNPTGVISERDILEKVLIPQRDPEKTLAKEIMSIPIVTMEEDEPLTKALRTMRKTGIPRLAVMRKGRLVGVLTQRTRR